VLSVWPSATNNSTIWSLKPEGEMASKSITDVVRPDLHVLSMDLYRFDGATVPHISGFSHGVLQQLIWHLAICTSDADAGYKILAPTTT